MLRETSLLVSPEGLACLVVGVTVQSRLGVEGALVGNLQLVDGIVVDGGDLLLCSSLLFGSLCSNKGSDGGCQRAIGQTHEDAVEPHLIGVDGFVPVYLVGNGARLVLQLLHHGLHGQQVLGLRPVLVHAGDEVTGADVVQIVVKNIVAGDVALLVNHLVGVHLAVFQDVVATIFEIGVEHAFQFDAHDIRPLGFSGKVEHVRLRHALHFRVGQPFRVVLIRFLL